MEYLRHLAELHLPEEDRHLIAHLPTILHSSSPTKELASSPGSDAWKGKTWTDSTPEREALARDFDSAAEWAAQIRWPLYVGEFSSYQEADLASRVRWTRALVSEARKRGFSWADWEFCSNYDPAALTWREPLLQSLIGNPNGKQN